VRNLFFKRSCILVISLYFNSKVSIQRKIIQPEVSTINSSSTIENYTFDILAIIL